MGKFCFLIFAVYSLAEWRTVLSNVILSLDISENRGYNGDTSQTDSIFLLFSLLMNRFYSSVLLVLSLCLTPVTVTFIAGLVQAQTVEDKRAEAEKLNQEAIQSWRTSRYTEALEKLQQALVIFREIKDRQGEAEILTGIGTIYSSIGKPQEALTYLKNSLSLRKEVGDRAGEATTLNNIGLVYAKIGQPTRGVELLPAGSSYYP